MKLQILSILIVTCALLSSCAIGKQTSSSIESSRWKLIRMNNEQKSVFAENDNFTIGFTAKDSTLNGVAACNRFFGKYELKKAGKIDIRMGGSTRMACPNMDLEQPFFLMLDQADSYSIKDGKLFLYLKGKECGVFVRYK